MIRTRHNQALLWLLSLLAFSQFDLSQAQFILSEAVYDNQQSLFDEDGDESPWVEVTNISDSIQTTRGFKLRNARTGDEWVFPDRTVEAHDSILVFLSGKGRQEPEPPTSVSPILPLQANIEVWLDASATSSLELENSGEVLEWRDLATGQKTFLQAEATQRPRLETTPIENLSGVLFDGVDDYLLGDEVSNIQTLFWVGREHPFASNALRPFLGHLETYDFHRGDDRILFNQFSAPDMATARTRLDGVPVTGAKARPPASRFMLSSRPTRPVTFNTLATDRVIDDRTFQGWIHEVIAYSVPLSDTDVALVEGYLRNKWQLPQTFLHTDFQLQNQLTSLILISPQGIEVSRLPGSAPEPDLALGRRTETSQIEYSRTPTPGTAFLASDASPSIASPPDVYPPSGVYPEPFQVSFDYDGPGEIRYSINARPPTEDSALYDPREPIEVGESMILMWRVFQDNALPSETKITSYLLVEGQVRLPLLAITMNPFDLVHSDYGIYVDGENASSDLPYFGANYWRDWEREAYIELFDPNRLTSPLIQQEAGIKIHGGWSRALPQKSFALIARDRYGSDRFRSNYLFPDKPISSYKQLLLRNGGNDWSFSYLRDPLGSKLAGQLNLDYQAYQPAHVFLNSIYWGIYNLRERANEHFVADNHALKPSEIDMVEQPLRIRSGDTLNFMEFVNYLRNTSAEEEAFVSTVERYLDVDNFMDYMILELYVDNQDWPGNNIRAWRSRVGEDQRWRWLPVDLDGGFGTNNADARANSFERALSPSLSLYGPPWPPYILDRLIQHTHFRNLFMGRLSTRLNTTLSSANVLSQIDQIHDNLLPDFITQINRWGGQEGLDFISPASLQEWEGQVELLREFTRQRRQAMEAHAAQFFDKDAFHSLSFKDFNPETGHIYVNGLKIDPTQRNRYPDNTPIELQVIPAFGYQFERWNSINNSQARLIIQLQGPAELEPILTAVDPSSLPEFKTHSLVSGPFLLERAELSSEHSPLPASLTLVGTPERDPRLNTDILQLWTGSLDETERSRVEAAGPDGLLFQNTDRPGGSSEPTGYVAGALLSLDTRQVDEPIKVRWLAGLERQGAIPYALRLQYRLGPQERFQNLFDSEGRPVEFRATGLENGPQNYDVELPLAAQGKPMIQLLWRYYALRTDRTGNRDRIRLDNISVTTGNEVPAVNTGKLVINEIHYHPSTRDPLDEFIEIYNPNAFPINLRGWKLSQGIEFDFPDITVDPNGYLIVSPAPQRILNRFKEDLSVVGPWRGQLSNQSDEIQLRDADDKRVDRVIYADEGAWSRRVPGESDNGFTGWTWSDAHDGRGASLELISTELSNNSGYNWTPSDAPWGSPGQINSAANLSPPPLIRAPRHSPLIPTSTDPIRIEAEIESIVGQSFEATLHYRIATPDDTHPFDSIRMNDLGRDGDQSSRDNRYSAVIPPHNHGDILEYYIAARSANGLRIIPPEAHEGSDHPRIFFLLQIDDEAQLVHSPSGPVHRLIYSPREWQLMTDMDALPWNASSNAEMNATFISTENGRQQLRYLVGVRLRGSTSRITNPVNRRINFRSDQPWRGRDAVNLNTRNTHSQILGAAIFRQSGVPTASARPVVVIQNNQNLANQGARQFGHYAEVDVYDGHLAQRLFPSDAGGNLYRAQGEGNLEYLGDDPLAYNHPSLYLKRTKAEVNDWSDLIELTKALSNPEPASYLELLTDHVDIDEWVNYFATHAIATSVETSLGTGGRADYGFYRGETDTRVRLLAYDLDSLFGIEGGLTARIDRAASREVIERFLKEPAIAKRFHRRLLELADTVFRPDLFDATVDTMLGQWVTEATRNNLKQANVDRLAFVRQAIPRSVKINADLDFFQPEWLRYYQANQNPIALSGVTDVTRTVTLTVNGQNVPFDPLTGVWTTMTTVPPSGITALSAVARDANREVIDVDTLRVYRQPAQVTSPPAMAPGQNLVWGPSMNPITINRDFEVPAGSTLTLEPGVYIQFNNGSTLLVRGVLEALGTHENRIFFSRSPGQTQNWKGLRFLGGEGRNRLFHVTFEYVNSPTLYAENSFLEVDDLRFVGAYERYIRTENASLIVRNTNFPKVFWGEPISGVGLPQDGQWRIENCVFNGAIGYNDIIDFSGGKLPHAIPQFIHNTFLTGPDDGLDLDGTDALIRGNRFIELQKDNTSTSDAAAIAAGRYESAISNLAIVNNLFLRNDQDVLLKEDSYATLQFNTFANTRSGSIAFIEEQRNTAPPRGIEGRSNIVWPTTAFKGLEATRQNRPDLVVDLTHSILPPGTSVEGLGNQTVDPLLAVSEDSVKLSPLSPAAYAQVGMLAPGFSEGFQSLFTRQPLPVTPNTEATFEVRGKGMSHYRFALDSGPYSEAFPIETPIHLEQLSAGEHQLHVIGEDLAGNTESAPTLSKRWTIEPTASPLRITEILAINQSLPNEMGETPDYIEISNISSNQVDLSRMQLSDDVDLANKFIFPSGFSLAPLEAVLIYADGSSTGTEPSTSTGPFHAPFRLSGDGDRVILRARFSQGQPILHQLTFGPQVPDMALGLAQTGEWTLTHPSPGQPLSVAANLSPAAALKLSELHPAPKDSNPYLEIINPAPYAVSLAGLHLSGAPDTEPEQTAFKPFSYLAAKTTLLIEEGDAEYPFPISQEFGLLGLMNKDRTPIDQASYVNASHDLSLARENGTDGPFINAAPTPGFENTSSAEPGVIRLNEVYAASDSNAPDSELRHDWVELYNPNSVPISLSQCYLTDNVQEPQKWAFPDLTIGAQGFLRIWLSPDNPALLENANFALKRNGDRIFLYGPAETDGRLIEMDSVEFGFQTTSHSLARVPLTSAWTLGTPTPEAPNELVPLGDPSAIVINEWMAAPDSGDDWIELFNRGQAPVSLAGMRLSDSAFEEASHRMPEYSYLGTNRAAYLRLFADGSDAPSRLPFKLSRAGESIVLRDVSGRILDQIDFENQQSGVSEGRSPDGASLIVGFLNAQSPGGPNFFDSDLDGMPDSWELDFGLNPLDAEDALGDLDNDEISNLDEYRQGRSPIIADLPLSIDQFLVGDRNLTFHFHAEADSVHQIEMTTDLSAGNWQVVATDFPRNTPQTVTLIVPRTDKTSSAFFRLVRK